MRTVAPSFLHHMFPQDAIRKTQTQLAKAQVELSSERHADMLEFLSGQTGRNIRWHAEIESVEGSIQSNKLHKTRADLAQNSLGSLGKVASNFLKDLIGSRGAIGGEEIIRTQASNSLGMMRDILNVELNGSFLFAGRTDTGAPVREYVGGAAQTQFDSLFLAEFGFSKTNPATQTISQSQIETFLNGNLETLFSSPTWESTTSNARGDNVRVYLGDGQSVDVLANSNEKSIRQLYGAVVSVMELAASGINKSSFEKLLDVAASKVSSAVQGLADIQARIGINQNTLESANAQLSQRKSWLSGVISETESVDSYEVATKINQLTTQLEASYSVTSRLSRLSLMNYL